MPLSFDSLRLRLDGFLHASIHGGADDQNGIFLPSDRPEVQRPGLALEATPGLLPWAAREGVDALFLHRPWGLSEEDRQALAAADIGVLAYHLAFDERLTTGFNPALAEACGWGAPEVLGLKADRPLGMACRLPEPARFRAVAEGLHAVFGDLDEVVPPAAGMDTLIGNTAVIGAMNDALVREAHARGVGLYATGQWRQPARVAVHETGLGVVVIGHRRSEQWGLRTLCGWLRAAGLDARLAPEA